MGADVVLLEDHKMGGDCLNYGCVPSKALIAAGKQAHVMRNGEKFGVKNVAPTVDYAAAKDHVRSVIATIEPVDSQERFEGLGVRVIRERGHFIDENTVKAGEHEITARRIVVATGSSPFVPPIPGLENVPYLTNESLWDLRELPKHLLVVGGGPIGIEMAQAHLRLGSKVTVIEGMKAMGKDDPEAANIVLDRMRDEGMEIAEDAMAEEIIGKEGDITVRAKDGREFRGTHLLMAVGRSANTSDLNLEAAKIDFDRRGIKVDDQMKTSNKKVYAIGDVAGQLQFTHVAGYHAGVVIRSILFGLPAKTKQGHIPWVTYTDPELAQVGMTEAEAKNEFDYKLEVVRFPFHENDRAIAEGKTTGLIKVMIVKGRPVGATIVGASAGELIGVYALAIANKLKMSQIAAMVAPYPTLGEVNKRAAGAYFSPRLFESDMVKKVVGFVQKYLP
jgi:pyruvate/2-oxoglutarate dehydrogenase complex dihydrolipoamide dehydrogenase (E3) component